MAGNGFSHTPKKVEKISSKYRKIKTHLPVPESIPLLEKMYSLESRSMHGQYPIIWDKAIDFQVFDKWGNKWIDFTSTIFVTNAGHGNRRIINGLKNVLNKPLLHTYTYANEERINYLEYLISNTPKNFQKAFMLSAGTETTEVAMKLMRLNAQKINKRKPGIICFDGSYHGRTLGAQMMSGNLGAKNWIGYEDPNIHHIPFPFPWELGNKSPLSFLEESLHDLEKKKEIDLSKDIGGILMETFQGWGAIFYPKEFVQEISTFAKKHNILLAFDEMQAGFGRTGKLFGYMHYDVDPDILCCGKGSSSSLPLSIVLGSSDIMDLPDIGSMSSTHSANPLCCISGHENLKSLIDDGLIENCVKMGIIFKNELRKIKENFPNYIKYDFCEGLVAALIFVDKVNNPLSNLCDDICEKAFQKGLLVVHTGRESIKLAPPLTINEDALLEGIDVLKECIQDAIKERF